MTGMPVPSIQHASGYAQALWQQSMIPMETIQVHGRVGEGGKRPRLPLIVLLVHVRQFPGRIRLDQFHVKIYDYILIFFFFHFSVRSQAKSP